jgi:phosphoribosylglycinamide formyltransferase-1
MQSMKNIVILISGRGSNMEAIVRVAKAEQWPARIAAVISNRADAPGLAFAAEQGIATAVVANTDYATREIFDAALQAAIDVFSPDIVILAGFMRILTAPFVAHYAGRMLNIHPSLLPSFPGLATHRRALESGVKVHGATVHFVSNDLDHGPIIAQAVVPVLFSDNENTLSARVLTQEHIIYPRAIRQLIEGKLSLAQGRVQVATDADTEKHHHFIKDLA